jgi:outer membrane protein assembly factor BamB
MSRLARFGILALFLGFVALLGAGAVGQEKKMEVAPAGFGKKTTTEKKEEKKDGPKSAQFSAIKLIENSQYRNWINVATQAIAAGKRTGDPEEWRVAVTVIQKILDTPEDFYVQIREKDAQNREFVRWASVKFEALNLLASMPNDGLDFYEQRYGGKALAALKEAKDTGNREQLAEVAMRWFYTRAGAEANDLLATTLLDRGQYFLAALRFERSLKLPAERYKTNDLTLFKAALAYQRSGGTKNAADLWKKLEDRLQDREGLRVGDQVIPLAKLRVVFHDERQPIAAGVYDWPMIRGNNANSAQATGSPPLLDQPLWTRKLLLDNDPNINEPRYHDNERTAKAQVDSILNNAANTIALPGFFPVSASGRLVFRAYGELRCIALNSEGPDTKPGDTVWRSSDMDGSLNQLLTKPEMREVVQPWLNNYANFPGLTGFANLLFENTMIGAISTDHQNVYAIDDLAIPSPDNVLIQNPYQPQVNVPTKIRPFIMQNCLYAFSLQEGKAKWSLGSFDTTKDAKDEFSDSHFLGPPISIGGKLYVLNEKHQGVQGDSELRLVCIDPNKVEKSRPHIVQPIQVLGSVDQRNRVTHAIARRVNGVHLAYGDGILVCPTNAGEMFGVDLMSRSLAWAYPYREHSLREMSHGGDPRLNGRVFIGGGFGPSSLAMSTVSLSKWKSTPPAIVDGKVVFTAPDADSVHCINLHDGTPRWKVGKLEGDLFFAGVVGKKVLLVGKNHMRALNLDDGRQMWLITTGDVPSGQGVASSGVYYQPLKKGEILAVDVERGAIKAHNRSKNSSFSPGNLIFSDGAVITVTPYEVVAYPQLLAKLEVADAAVRNDPNNAEKLVDRGEILLADGQVQKAVNDLQRALEQRLPAPLTNRAKNHLYEALTDLLQADFTSASAKYLDEYRQLCQLGETSQEKQKRQAKYFRIVGNGRETQGNLIEAFQMYKEFGSLPIHRDLGGVTALDDPSHKVPVDVWLRGRVSAMFAKATPEQRAPLEAKIAEEWKAVEAKNDVDAIRAFVGMFDVQFAVGREARLRLAEAIMERNDQSAYLEAELNLYQLRGAEFGRQVASGGKALAGLALLEEKRGSAESMQGASAYYRDLAREFPNDAVRQKKTGKDLFNDLAADKRLLPFLEESSSFWNQAQLTYRYLSGTGVVTAQVQQINVLHPESDPAPFLRRHRLVLETSAGNNLAPKLTLVDLSTGKNRWGPLVLSGFPTNIYISHLYAANQANHGANSRFRFYQSIGHLAVAQIGVMVYCLDMDQGKVLWQQSLVETVAQNPQLFAQQLMPGGDGGLELLVQNNMNGQPQSRRAIGQIGAVHANYVALVSQLGLQVIDPVRGNVLWKKIDVPSGSRVFGDDQHIFIVEIGEGGTTAATRVLRASDGEPVNSASFADEFQGRIRIDGRRILTVTSGRDAKKTLRLYDALTGKDVWSKPISAQAVLTATDDQNLIGWIEPNGMLTALDARTGAELLSTSVVQGRITVDDVRNLREPLLLADSERFYVALNHAVLPGKVGGSVIMNNFQNGLRCRHVNGYVLAFHRHTGPVKMGRKMIEAVKGELAWHSVGPVENQMLVTEQWDQLPILLFSGRYNRQLQPGVNTFSAATLALHKQTGKIPYDSGLNTAINAQAQFTNLIADPRQGTIQLLGNSKSIQFYVDDGRKVEVPAGMSVMSTKLGEGLTDLDNPAAAQALRERAILLQQQQLILRQQVIIRQQAIAAPVPVAPPAPVVDVPKKK